MNDEDYLTYFSAFLSRQVTGFTTKMRVLNTNGHKREETKPSTLRGIKQSERKETAMRF